LYGSSFQLVTDVTHKHNFITFNVVNATNLVRFYLNV
jgi:hypothetical protein